MKIHVTFVVLSLLLLAGCGGHANGARDAATEEQGTTHFKIACSSVDACEKDARSADPYLRAEANKYLSARKMMDQMQDRTMNTESAALQARLAYWRHVTLYCGPQDAKLGRCVSLDSPDIPDRIREILKKEASASSSP